MALYVYVGWLMTFIFYYRPFFISVAVFYLLFFYVLVDKGCWNVVSLVLLAVISSLLHLLPGLDQVLWILPVRPEGQLWDHRQALWRYGGPYSERGGPYGALCSAFKHAGGFDQLLLLIPLSVITRGHWSCLCRVWCLVLTCVCVCVLSSVCMNLHVCVRQAVSPSSGSLSTVFLRTPSTGAASTIPLTFAYCAPTWSSSSRRTSFPPPPLPPQQDRGGAGEGRTPSRHRSACPAPAPSW